MAKATKTPAQIKYYPGELYSFRTSPFNEFSPAVTGRYGVLKVLGFERNSVCCVTLDGVFASPPDMEQAGSLPWLRKTFLNWKGTICARAVSLDFTNDLQDFRLIGSVPLLPEDLELLAANRTFGTFLSASHEVECQWRWKHDRAALEAEHKLADEAWIARRAAADERYEKRLKRLTWDQLLSEQFFVRWNEHPPFPPPEFVAATREQVRATILQLQALGPKPKKSAVRAALKACVEWFNRMDDQYGGVIYTDEREDIHEVLSELAFVAKQRSVADEIEQWRSW